MSVLDALNRVGLSNKSAGVIPPQQSVERPQMAVQPVSLPAKDSGPSESFQHLPESEIAVYMKMIGMDGQQVRQREPEPATMPTEAPGMASDGPEPEAGSNSGGETATESKADSGQAGGSKETNSVPDNFQKVIDSSKVATLHWNDITSRTYWMKGKFYFRHDKGRWGEYQEKDYRTVLEGTAFFGHLKGENAAQEKGMRAAYFEKLKRHVFENNTVVFVGELAGYKEGVTVWKGQKYLITRGPGLLEVSEGDFPTIRGLLLQTFGEEQLPYFLGWLKIGYESLLNGEMNTGQALVIAGEPGVGKSCIKELIIRPVLGGRNCDPAAFLQGDTRFNSDLSGNEVWEMDDQIGVSDAHRRKTYETAFKKLAANSNHRVEGKGTNAVQPPPLFHRLVVCTNDNESDLFVLPPQTDSTADKMIVLKAYKTEQPLVKLPDVTGRKVFREQIERELPAFVGWLRNWEIPADKQDSRYGVKAYRNPDLASKLDGMSDEGRLLEMVDILVFEFQKHQGPWTGSLEALELTLRQAAKESNMSNELGKVLWNRNALQQALGKLKGPAATSRVSRKHTKHGNVWTIQPPNWEPELIQSEAKSD